MDQKKYLYCSSLFHDVKPVCPAHWFFPEDDTIGPAKACLKVINKWKSKGMDVSFTCWEMSKDAEHIRWHEQDYIQAWTAFMQKQNLGSLGVRSGEKLS